MSSRNHRNRQDSSNGSGHFSPWGDRNVNIVLGCPNRCRYCYARAAAKCRGRIRDLDEWGTTHFQLGATPVDKGWKNYGAVRFPTTHDITPEFLEECITVARNLLASGNHVIVCSKPRLDCIRRLCCEFADNRRSIEFRFTIGAMDDDVLRYWEPGAPGFRERFDSLRYASGRGFDTSVNIEPMLDAPNVMKLFRRLSPYVNVFINIGKMLRVRYCVQSRTRRDEAAVRRIEDNQSDDRIREIYEDLKDEPLVRWAPSIREVVGLKTPKKCGMVEPRSLGGSKPIG